MDNKDCFAYEARDCKVLRKKDCEGCRFYKTKEQFERDQEFARKRLYKRYGHRSVGYSTYKE